MAKLVETDELQAYMSVTEDDDIISAIRDSVESLLEKQTGQTFGPSAALTEVLDGHGTKVIYLGRPIASIASVTIIRPPNDVIELTYDVVSDITFAVGKTRVVSHGFNFPLGKDNIQVVYTCQENKPEIARQAVRDVVAILYRRRGHEEARSEQIGTFEHVMMRALKESLSWDIAVASLHRPNIG